MWTQATGVTEPHLSCGAPRYTQIVPAITVVITPPWAPPFQHPCQIRNRCVGLLVGSSQ